MCGLEGWCPRILLKDATEETKGDKLPEATAPRGNVFAHSHEDSFRGTPLCSGSSPAASLPQQLLSSWQDHQELPGLKRWHNGPLRERPERAPGCQECACVWAPPAFPDCEVGRFCTYVLAHTCFCSNLDSQNSCSVSKSSGFPVKPPTQTQGLCSGCRASGREGGARVMT